MAAGQSRQPAVRFGTRIGSRTVVGAAVRSCPSQAQRPSPRRSWLLAGATHAVQARCASAGTARTARPRPGRGARPAVHWLERPGQYAVRQGRHAPPTERGAETVNGVQLTQWLRPHAEELTRMPAEVQDALITVLSEKTLPVPELGIEVQAVPGFTLVATANDRDRGINEMSSALKRRFNTVVLPLPATQDTEVEIVSRRVAELGRALQLPAEPPALAEVRRVVQIFRELRSGLTEDGRTTLKTPTGTLSTAEAISVLTSGMTLAAHFGDGRVNASDVAAGLVGAVVKSPVQDGVAWNEYLEAVVKERKDWRDLYRACRDLSVTIE